jgi:hypothetical protein
VVTVVVGRVSVTVAVEIAVVGTAVVQMQKPTPPVAV